MATTTRRKRGKTTLRAARASKGKAVVAPPAIPSQPTTGQEKSFGQALAAVKQRLQAALDFVRSKFS
jgi:hypothetical protein